MNTPLGGTKEGKESGWWEKVMGSNSRLESLAGLVICDDVRARGAGCQPCLPSEELKPLFELAGNKRTHLMSVGKPKQTVLLPV